jgi:hypothetical protein
VSKTALELEVVSDGSGVVNFAVDLIMTVQDLIEREDPGGYGQAADFH